MVSYSQPLGDLGIIGMYSNISQRGEEVIIILGRADILLGSAIRTDKHSSKVKLQSSSFGQFFALFLSNRHFSALMFFLNQQRSCDTRVLGPHVTCHVETGAFCSLLPLYGPC